MFAGMAGARTGAGAAAGAAAGGSWWSNLSGGGNSGMFGMAVLGGISQAFASSAARSGQNRQFQWNKEMTEMQMEWEENMMREARAYKERAVNTYAFYKDMPRRGLLEGGDPIADFHAEHGPAPVLPIEEFNARARQGVGSGGNRGGAGGPAGSGGVGRGDERFRDIQDGLFNPPGSLPVAPNTLPPRQWPTIPSLTGR